MPELPEVETVVRSLAAHLEGQTIASAILSSHLVTRGDINRTARLLAGRRIVALRRRGKQILAELDSGLLYIHLGMTGKLLWNAVPGKHARAILELDSGRLVFDDIRQFGRFEYYASLPKQLDRIGPDALEVSFDEFYERLRAHRTRIKPLLLNQSIFGGLGNIYVDELLFRAGIHPRRLASGISQKRAHTLHSEIGPLLRTAIEQGGSSISDYVDAAGQRGSFQVMHQVYGRTGMPCLICGTPVRRIVVAQRGTHFCPKCQR
ncbi:MAG TPA: bifunctional DNA-formamidopyrimidine glycosylase/DNA-(apurinic or apyrimidinic site) lyase [Bryobacteraceae bacterium]|nr:bifunctional DNA-formamidopyrimidine glycosylase/DNA-(apurinic or apyrimidinic site) lyase [Bryobacteraceae bacterium]